jgi:hypothetical protein
MTMLGYALAALAATNLAVPIALWYFDFGSRLSIWTSNGFESKDEVIGVLMRIVTGLSQALIGHAILLSICSIIILRHHRSISQK